MNTPRPAVALLMAVLTLAIGCQQDKQKKAMDTPAPLTFQGPAHLHGTIGSFTQLNKNHSQIVSGFGLVVGLNGTGSSDVPTKLRANFIQDMKKKLGPERVRNRHLQPEVLLDSENTAFVVIQGLIPPGAIPGTRFDVLVTAHPATDTTSLEGGRLWSADLAIAGANVGGAFMLPRARGAGPVYLNPLESKEESQTRSDKQLTRVGVILAGGVVLENGRRHIELVLNQPSWTRSGQIADRINERFRRSEVERLESAVAINDTIVNLNVPTRFAGNTRLFLELVGHLFLARGSEFEKREVENQLQVLLKNPEIANDVQFVWEGLGRKALPRLRELYVHPKVNVRMTALNAGSRLGDARTVDHLALLAKHPDVRYRQQAANMLAYLPDHPKAVRTLHEMVNDEKLPVRLAAYRAMAGNNDPLIQRMAIGEREEFKFLLELVPSEKPLIYVSQANFPRVTIFGNNTSFKFPVMAKLWDNRLMLRGKSKEELVDVYYQQSAASKPHTEPIAPTVANLVFLMGHKPSIKHQTPGFDMTYSQVVNALYGLSKQKQLAADMEIQVNLLAQHIAKVDKDGDGFERPETNRAKPTGEPRSPSPVGGEKVGSTTSDKPDAVASSKEPRNFFNPFAKPKKDDQK